MLFICFMHTYEDICIYRYIYIHTFTITCVYACTCIYIHNYIVYIYIYIYTYIYIHIYIYIHTSIHPQTLGSPKFPAIFAPNLFQKIQRPWRLEPLKGGHVPTVGKRKHHRSKQSMNSWVFRKGGKMGPLIRTSFFFTKKLRSCLVKIMWGSMVALLVGWFVCLFVCL